MADEQSKRKTDCEKQRFTSPHVAEKVAKRLAIKFGQRTRVMYCTTCKVFHITTNFNGRHSRNKNKNVPETIRMQRIRYKRRLKFPTEVWENEGGALHSNE